MSGFLAVLLDHPLLLIVRIALLRLPFVSAALIIAINNSTAAIFHLRIPPLLSACQQVLLFLPLISVLPPPTSLDSSALVQMAQPSKGTRGEEEAKWRHTASSFRRANKPVSVSQLERHSLLFP